MSSGAGCLCDIEGTVRWLYNEVCCDLHDPPILIELAERTLGIGSVQFVPSSWLSHRGRLVRSRTQPHLPGIRPDTAEWYIQVKRKLHVVDLTWAIAHELAEWLLRQVLAVIDENIEQIANTLAAALILPREVMLPHIHEPPNFVLAPAHCVTPSCFALRWAEVSGEPVMVVSPSGVHRRGDIWTLDDGEARRLARAQIPPVSGVRPIHRFELPGRRVILVGLPGEGRYLAESSRVRARATRAAARPGTSIGSKKTTDWLVGQTERDLGSYTARKVQVVLGG